MIVLMTSAVQVARLLASRTPVVLQNSPRMARSLAARTPKDHVSGKTTFAKNPASGTPRVVLIDQL